MLTTAGTTSAIFAVGVLTGALIVSAWEFLDLVARPSPACKVATCLRIDGSSCWGFQHSQSSPRLFACC